MRNALLLAWRYMRFHRARTAILLVVISIALYLPAAVHVLVGRYHRLMIARAEQTPLVVGAKGSAYDLVLGALYFKGRLDQRLTMAQVREIRATARARAVPLYLRYTAGGHPIVGTTLDYFEFRRLRVARGRLPQLLGEAVLGAAAARRLEVRVGDKILTDHEKVYDISSSYPLLMRVAGILADSGTADDLAVFCDIKTTWIIKGIGHGHLAARDITDPALINRVTGRNIVMSGAVMQHNEVTPKLLESFHFHGDQSKYPVSAVVILPDDAKSRTILTARYRRSGTVQAAVPSEVVRKMMDIVFRVKRFLDAIFATVLVSTGLFLVLVILLSLRIRRREIQTLHKIGCSRWTVAGLQAAEIAILLAVSAAVAAALLGGTLWYVVRFNVLL